MRYRRANAQGGTYFFTVNLADRSSDKLVHHIGDLRTVIENAKEAHPFAILAMVVLPEHLHALWRLPPGDADYPLRWSQIKAGFSRRLAKDEHIHASRRSKRERGIWQRRYWEHQIRNEDDLARHVDYIHFNPVKHGWVTRPADWPHSTLHREALIYSSPRRKPGSRVLKDMDSGVRRNDGMGINQNFHSYIARGMVTPDIRA